MSMLSVITKKKNGQALSYDEIKYAFMGYLEKTVPDYQMSALLMAITINGMNMSETISLTDIMIKSGDMYDLTDYLDTVVDKHSTGGVGDSTTLAIGPMCAALGLHMAKMSGRGLGLTGGTIDKLESIPGFRVDLPEKEFFEQVRSHGFAVCAQTKNLTPLDKVIYELRDVSGTTESIPLIASSIMAKKLAAGATNILIDIKVGSGALVKTMEEAQQLSKWVIAIGEAYNRKVRTVISDMNTPLSSAVGNALEIAEVINVLHGKDCPLLRKCIELTAILLSMTTDLPLEEAKVRAKDVIASGEALKKFYEFVRLQGGRLADLDLSNIVIPVYAKKSGKIKRIDAYGAAKLAAKVGASKQTIDDPLEYGAGIVLEVHEGDIVKKDDLLLKIYCDEIPELKESSFEFIEIQEI